MDANLSLHWVVKPFLAAAKYEQFSKNANSANEESRMDAN